MAENMRVRRMEAIVRDELSSLVCTEVADPAVRNMAITKVKMTGDLRRARVFYQTSEGGGQGALGLQRASSFLRRRLGERIGLRYVPALEFSQDVETDAVWSVLKRLEGISREGECRGNTAPEVERS